VNVYWDVHPCNFEPTDVIFFFSFHIIIIFSEGFRVLTAARLLRESKAGQWKNVLVAKARGFLEIVVRFSSEFFSFCTFYVC